jgi:PTH2 family peptidyl-tRNA hydrolase
MFKMVFVVNSSLKMSTGKIASQTAHSAVSLYIKAKSEGRKKWLLVFDEIDVWVRTGQAKVVLKGQSAQQLLDLEKKAADMGLSTETIRDAGRTQIAPGSLTCLAIFGRIADVDAVTGSLPLY